MKINRLLVAALGVLTTPWALSAQYHFRPIVENAVAEVRIHIDKESTEFRMPAWAPGDYQIYNYGTMIESVQFFKDGKPAEGSKPIPDVDPNLWTIPGGADEVRYFVKPSRGNFSVNLRVREGDTFVSGPGVFGWFKDHQKEKQTLTIQHVPQQTRVYSDLKPIPSQAGTSSLEAENYDAFLDAPFAIGDSIREHAFQVGGKNHYIIAIGAPDADLFSFERVGTAAAKEALKMFGELPYPRYLFFCDFGGGGGGLEHANSTRLGLGRNAKGEQTTGFIFHEYFHAFNVKRIRPRVLGPFDYTKPAVTGTLWWMEGVTDYYAEILPVRAALGTRERALSDLSRTVDSFGRNTKRLEVSADESSRRVWETRGSGGFGFSYYTKGKIIGLCLDLAIRGETGGKRSLDDVTKALYQETKNGKPGFEEGRIRELCIQFGGPALGDIYDKCVMKAVEMPFAEVLPKVGMKIENGAIVEDEAAAEGARAIGQAWPMPVGG